MTNRRTLVTFVASVRFCLRIAEMLFFSFFFIGHCGKIGLLLIPDRYSNRWCVDDGREFAGETQRSLAR